VERLKKQRAVRQVLLRTLVLNWSVAAAKTICGLWTGALSMTADGFHSFMDGTSNIIGLIALGAAAKPPDASHPYGHRKFETLATLGIAILLMFAAYEIAVSAIGRFGSGTVPSVTPISFIVMLGTLVINTWVSRYESRWGRELGSALLCADALHTRTDIYASLSVLASLAAARAGYAVLDILVALLIVVIIAWAAVKIAHHGLNILTDAARVDPMTIQRVALSVPGVWGCHHIRSRGFEDAIAVDCHIWVDPKLSTTEAHRLTHVVMDRVQAEVPGVVEVIIHTEPARASGPSDAETGHES
jgi:cation diffusion facilitator family transporter